MLWSLSKTPETGAYALSSSSRTTLLLVAKESNGRISYKPREKEDTLSLKMGEQASSARLPSPSRFVFFFSFCFSSFLYLISFSHHFFFSFLFLFLPIFSSFFAFLSSFLNHYTYETKMRKFPPHIPQTK